MPAKTTKAEEANTWCVDLSGWTTIGQIVAWQDTVGTGNIRAISTAMSAVVKEWPLEGDPTSPMAYLALSPGDWARAVKAVGDEVGRFFQDALG